MWAFSFIFILITVQSFAVSPLPSSLQFESDFTITSEVDFQKLDQGLEKKDFMSLEVKGDFYPVIALDWLNRLYVNKKSGALVMIKTFLKPTQKIHFNTLYDLEFGYLAQIKSSIEGRSHVVFFSGMSEFQMNETLQTIQKTQVSNRVRKSSKTVLLLNQMLPLAKADTKPESSSKCLSDSVSKTKIHFSGPNDSALFQASWGCLKGIGGGVWNSTIGGFSMLFDPAKAFRQLKQDVQKIAGIFTDFSKTMETIAGGFGALPLELKSHVICEVITSLGLGMTINFLTGGAATAFVVKMIAEVFLKVMGTMGRSKEALDFYHQLTKIAGKIEIPDSIRELQKTNLQLNNQKRRLTDQQQILKSVERERNSPSYLTGRYAQKEKVKLSEQDQAAREEIRKLKKEIEDAEKKVTELEKAAFMYKTTEVVGKTATVIGVRCATTQGVSENVQAYLNIIERQKNLKPTSPQQPRSESGAGVK